ncbi:unnamed protein product [Lactuca virosa]|uniref:Uncharacterized protein n=1 Tax=Lactuca virosa TaxID=75947 RepID=A0AAU9NWI4_9ASTR|nr:unnamed protein product [Lactuca virosa]
MGSFTSTFDNQEMINFHHHRIKVVASENPNPNQRSQPPPLGSNAIIGCLFNFRYNDSWPSHLIFVFTTLQGMQFMENISIEEEVVSGVRKRHESEKEGFIGLKEAFHV